MLLIYVKKTVIFILKQFYSSRS